MAGFLIEFRLQGYARKYAEWARARTLREAKRLGVRRLKERGFVPHITLFGSAETDSIRNVIRAVERTGRRYTLVPFRLGVERGDFRNPNALWLYLDIRPSPELRQLRDELARSLLKSERRTRNTCKSYDRGQHYKFHCSIGSYDPRDRAKFERLAQYAETQCSLEDFRRRRASPFTRLMDVVRRHVFRMGEADSLAINQHLLRITVLGKKSRIQAEYDLVLKRTLSRRQALGRYWWRMTSKALRIELSPLQEERLPPFGASQCHFIGDTHFGHKNIIRYCRQGRFSGVTEMNEAMIGSWNARVSEADRVYFLGDYTGPPSRNYYEELRCWTRQLKGTKVSLLGNHDRIGGCIDFAKAKILHAEGHSFLLIHDPSDEKTKTIKGKYDWVIHGHVHNNDMDTYPFINGEQRTINVSAEVLNYVPVSLSHLLSLDLDSIKRMRTIESTPERW